MTLSPRPLSTSSLRKRVTFSETVKARLTTHINNFTSLERNAYWYTPDEFKRIRADISATMQLIEMEIDISSSPEFCARGLETQTVDGARQRTEKKQRVWKALSLEQQSQRQRRISNAQALADVYAAQVQECKVAAYAMGLADQTQEQVSVVTLRTEDFSTKTLNDLTTKWDIFTTGSKKAALVQTIRHRRLFTQAA